jgi:hypothetical protein
MVFSLLVAMQLLFKDKPPTDFAPDIRKDPKKKDYGVRLSYYYCTHEHAWPDNELIGGSYTQFCHCAAERFVMSLTQKDLEPISDRDLIRSHLNVRHAAALKSCAEEVLRLI